MKLENIKKYKSSILGMIFIAFGLYVLAKGITTDYLIIGCLEIGGILLLFTGDRFIQQLEKAVFGRVLFEKKENVNNEQR